MSTAAEAIKQNMSLFERYLTLWVALCIIVGVALGHFRGIDEYVTLDEHD